MKGYGTQFDPEMLGGMGGMGMPGMGGMGGMGMPGMGGMGGMGMPGMGEYGRNGHARNGRNGHARNGTRRHARSIKNAAKQRAMFEKVQRASPKEREALMKQMEEMMSNFGEGGGGMGSRNEDSMSGFIDVSGGGTDSDAMETVDLDGPQVLSAGTSDYDML